MAKVRYQLRGFSGLLRDIAEDYRMTPTDVLLLLQIHSEECASFFSKGEECGRQLEANNINNFLKEADEISKQDSKNN